MNPFNYSKVREMREQLGIGIEAAKQILRREQLLEAVAAATTVEDLKPILVAIIKKEN